MKKSLVKWTLLYGPKSEAQIERVVVDLLLRGECRVVEPSPHFQVGRIIDTKFLHDTRADAMRVEADRLRRAMYAKIDACHTATRAVQVVRERVRECEALDAQDA